MATYSWDNITGTKVAKPTKADKTDELIKRASLTKKYVQEQRMEQEARETESPYQKKNRMISPVIEENVRVVLSNSSRYPDSPENPKENGSYACVGTVLYADADVEVEWDNGIINHYHPEDLIVVEDDRVTNNRWKMWGKAGDTSKIKEDYAGKFKVGTMVYLMPKFYGPQQSNPCLGSRYQCVGEVVRAYQTDRDKQHITVRWANGAKNSYRFSYGLTDKGTCLIEAGNMEALKQLLESDPNLSFKAQFGHKGGLVGSTSDYLRTIMEKEK